jgi:hypothetical protein
MSAPVPDERLIDLLLDRGPEAARELAALRAEGTGAATAARIAALEELLGAAAHAVRAPELFPPGAEAARRPELVRRILARTTREDLSWRGDLRLVVRHVKERMRESRFTRFVAALLLGNLTLGPVVALAWIVTREPEPELELHFRVEPGGDLLPAPDADGAERLQPLETDALPLDDLGVVADARTAARRDNLLRRARYLLAPAHGAVPAPVAPEAAASAPAPVRLLDARARILAGGAWPSWLDDARFEGADELLAGALHAEILLDRFALRGERAPRFHAVLEALKRAAADAAADDDGPARSLAAHALERAASYGALERGSAPGPLDPCDPAWTADLAGALGEMGAEPHAAAWLALGR